VEMLYINVHVIIFLIWVLIQAVEKRRFLYDKEENNYGNKNFINAKWKKNEFPSK